MRSAFARWVLPAAAIAVMLLVWEWSFRLAGLNPKLFPQPSAIFAKLVALFIPKAGGAIPPIFSDVGSSVGRLILGMAVAIIVGPLIGVFMGTDRRVYGALAPIVNALLPIPPYAYIPILLFWIGAGSKTIVAATALAAALPLIYTTTGGVRGIDRHQIWVLQTFGAGRIQIIRHVVIPAAFAAIISGLRQSFGQGWRTLIGGEFIAAPASGLGFLIFSARDFLAVDVMFAGLVLLSILGFLSIYVLVAWIEKRTLVRWGLMVGMTKR